MGISWKDVAVRGELLPLLPPFVEVTVKKLKCKLCGGELEYGTRWYSGGWMWGTRECCKCHPTHLITDSEKFCAACHHRSPDCIIFPQVFIREDH